MFGVGMYRVVSFISLVRQAWTVGRSLFCPASVTVGVVFGLARHIRGEPAAWFDLLLLDVRPLILVVVLFELAAAALLVAHPATADVVCGLFEPSRNAHGALTVSYTQVGGM